MKNKSWRRVFQLFLLLIFIGSVLTACQTLPFKSNGASLKQRVKGMMEAKINQDWGRFYSYLEPAFKEKVSKKDFVNKKRGVRFTGFSIKSIQIKPSGKEAVVEVLFDMTIKSYSFTDQEDSQVWVKKKRNWYMAHQPTNALGIKPSQPGSN